MHTKGQAVSKKVHVEEVTSSDILTADVSSFSNALQVRHSNLQWVDNARRNLEKSPL